MNTHRPLLILTSCAVAAYLFAEIASVFVARVIFAGEPTIAAIVMAAFPSPYLAVVSFAPFLLLSGLAIWLSEKKGMKPALVLFASGSTLLSLLVFVGEYSSQAAIAQHAWTAAALSYGFLPIGSIPVLLILFVVTLFLRRKKPPATDS